MTPQLSYPKEHFYLAAFKLREQVILWFLLCCSFQKSASRTTFSKLPQISMTNSKWDMSILSWCVKMIWTQLESYIAWFDLQSLNLCISIPDGPNETRQLGEQPGKKTLLNTMLLSLLLKVPANSTRFTLSHRIVIFPCSKKGTLIQGPKRNLRFQALMWVIPSIRNNLCGEGPRENVS